jgi:site-specific recombinase XerD
MTTLPEPLDIGVENGKFSDISVDEAIAALDPDLLRRTVEFNRRARSDATLRSYATAWREFSDWCLARRLNPLPADARAVCAYLTDLARRGQKVATIRRKLTAISVAHRKAGEDSPRKSVLVADQMEGIERDLGVAQVKKTPTRTADLRALIATLDQSRLIGLRDRALLVVGFAGAFRRSELVAFDVAHFEERGRWLYATVARSKTDQKGEGKKVVMATGEDAATCPLRALRDWRSAAEITEGPVFRPVTKGGVVQPSRLSAKAVARVVKRTAEAAGMDPATYAGHSLRSGFITSAAEADQLERHIMRHSRHQSVKTVRGYMDEHELTIDNPSAAVGL